MELLNNKSLLLTRNNTSHQLSSLLPVTFISPFDNVLVNECKSGDSDYSNENGASIEVVIIRYFLLQFQTLHQKMAHTLSHLSLHLNCFPNSEKRAK